jgi:hypothetical protein
VTTEANDNVKKLCSAYLLFSHMLSFTTGERLPNMHILSIQCEHDICLIMAVYNITGLSDNLTQLIEPNYTSAL